MDLDGIQRMIMAKWAELGGLFVVHWTIPQPDLLEEFLHT
jgi:hypothetical protein